MEIETELSLELNNFKTFSNWSVHHALVLYTNMNFLSLCQARSFASIHCMCVHIYILTVSHMH